MQLYCFSTFTFRLYMASFRESPVSSSAIISLIERGSKLAQPSAKIVNFFPSMSISGKDGPVDSSMLSDSVPVCASVVSFVFPLSFPQEAMRFPAVSVARRSDMSLAFFHAGIPLFIIYLSIQICRSHLGNCRLAEYRAVGYRVHFHRGFRL